MLVKTFKRAGIGFLIGIMIGDMIAILTGTSSSGGISFTSKQLLDMAGGSAAAAMLLQSAERLPLAAATALHCALIVLIFIPISLLLGWVSQTVEVLIISMIQLAVFFIIWLILYFVYKKQVEELNEMMKDYSGRDE